MHLWGLHLHLLGSKSLLFLGATILYVSGFFFFFKIGVTCDKDKIVPFAHLALWTLQVLLRRGKFICKRFWGRAGRAKGILVKKIKNDRTGSPYSLSTDFHVISGPAHLFLICPPRDQGLETRLPSRMWQIMMNKQGWETDATERWVETVVGAIWNIYYFWKYWTAGPLSTDFGDEDLGVCFRRQFVFRAGMCTLPFNFFFPPPLFLLQFHCIFMWMVMLPSP